MKFFKDYKNIYFIGITGAGTAALAELLKKDGHQVTGADVAEQFFTNDILRRAGIDFFEGYDEKNIAGQSQIDLVIYSSSCNNENPELRWAMENNLEMMSYAEALGEISKQKFTIAVCGTHGKTTTAAMLAVAMKENGLDPSAIVGSKIQQLGTGAVFGESEYFVIEADEYQNKFQYYYPSVVVLTSIDYDHPDYFENFEEYKKVFKDFLAKLPPHGFLVAWGGDANVLEVAESARCNVIFYDFFTAPDSIFLIKDRFKKIGKSNVDFYTFPRGLALQLPGAHNKLNASAALALCKKLKMDEEKTKEILAGFKGTARRFEYKGKSETGAIVYDDYAHHPEEIRVTLKTFREKYPEKNIICVFHPHTYSRTEKLLGEFSQSFDNCDNLIVLDIYGSAREERGSVTSADLVEKIKKFKRWAEHIPTIEEAEKYLQEKIGPQDLVITMGAGNVFELGDRLVKKETTEKSSFSDGFSNEY